MGKTGSACFDIVSCGRVSADQKDFEKSESGQLLKKRRWSFRKRSSNRLLTTTVISVPLPPKEVEDDPVKISELIEHSFPFENPPPKNIEENLPPPSETYTDAHESAAEKIQGSIRRYLSHKESQKLKSVIKLQALVRGYLVRRQAAGTLRCVHAIVKMQALVRARLLKQSFAASPNQNDSAVREKKSCSSENLLKSPYARQLLESTRKSKPIHISCDHSKSDSAWKWLERWMTLSTPQDVDVADEVADDVAPRSELEEEKIGIKIPEESLEDDAELSSFAAMQAKFEELCSLSSPIPVNEPIKPCHVAASDCGTEISISSTLDSPDRSEPEGGREILMEVQTPETRDPPEQDFLSLEDTSKTEDSVNSENNKWTRNSLSKKQNQSVPETTDNGNSTDTTTLERESSPPSYVKATESAPEPDFLSMEDSSKNEDSVNVDQHSVNSKNSKRRRNPLTKKQNTFIPLAPVEKRRESMESGTLERESSRPSYMQATESARAKVNALTSPKSSPDVSREANGKRRQSAPLGNGKFDSSPRARNSSERRWLR